MCAKAVTTQDNTRLLLIQTHLADRLANAVTTNLPTQPRENQHLE